MQYEAPETTKAAVGLLAKAKGSAYVLAGGSDLLVRMKGGFIEPDLVVDIKRIKAMREVKKTATGFTIGAAVSCAELGENKALVEGLAGRRRGRQPHRLQAGAGPLHHRRQSLQRLARRRQRAGPGRRRRQGRDRRAPRASAPFRSSRCRSVPAAPRSRRARSSRRSCCRSAAAALGRCLSALHPAHRNGHRGGQRRRQPDARRQGRRHRRPRGAGRRCADRAAGAPLPPRPSSAPSSMTRRSRSSAAACSAACRPIDDKRGTIEFSTKVAGVLAQARREDRVQARRR